MTNTEQTVNQLIENSNLSTEACARLHNNFYDGGWDLMDLAMQIRYAQEREALERQAREIEQLLAAHNATPHEHRVCYEYTLPGSGFVWKADAEDYGVRITRIKVTVTRYLQSGDDDEPYVTVEGLGSQLLKNGDVSARGSVVKVRLPKSMAKELVARAVLT